MKFASLLPSIFFLAFASNSFAARFNIQALSGYREYEFKIRCNLNDTSVHNAIDTLGLPGGAFFYLHYFAPGSVTPESQAPDWDGGLLLNPATKGDTVLIRSSAQYARHVDYAASGWVTDNPDSSWTQATRWPTSTDSADWTTVYSQTNTLIHRYGTAIWSVSENSEFPTLRFVGLKAGYKAQLYGKLASGHRFRIQVDTFAIKSVNNSYPQYAVYFLLKVGYDATGQGVFEDPIVAIRKSSKQASSSATLIAPAFHGFYRFDPTGALIQLNGRRLGAIPLPHP